MALPLVRDMVNIAIQSSLVVVSHAFVVSQSFLLPSDLLEFRLESDFGVASVSRLAREVIHVIVIYRAPENATHAWRV